jgi:hypothetical protein
MSSVWMAVADALEDLVRKFGLARLTAVIGTVFGVAVGLGLAFDQTVLFLSAGGALMLVLLLTVLAQSVDRRRLNSEIRDLGRVLDRYAADIVERQDSDYFHVASWKEANTVARGGDVTIERWLALTVGAEPMQALWHRCYKTATPKTRIDRDKVVVEARSFMVVNNKPQLGVRYPVTKSWDRNSLRIFVHFDEALAPASTTYVYLRFFWPGYLRELLEEGLVESFEWTFRRAIQGFSATVHFDGGIGLRDDFFVLPIGNVATPVQNFHQADRSLDLTFTPPNPHPNEKIGFRLERRT